MTTIDRVLRWSALLSMAMAISAVAWAYSERSAHRGYVESDALTGVPEVNFGNAPATLVLWIDSSCKPCIDSMDFYRTVAAARRTTRIVVLGHEPQDLLNAFVAQYGVTADQVLSVPDRGLKFQGTPTVVLVDAKARVRRVWFGRLDDEKERHEVIDAVQK